MIEITTLSGRKTAILCEPSDVDELERTSGVESLWLTPKTGTFNRLEGNLECLKVLYVNGISQKIVDIIDSEVIRQLEVLVVAESTGCLIGMLEIATFIQMSKLKIRNQSICLDEEEWVMSLDSLVSLAITNSNLNDRHIAGLKCKESLRRLDVYCTPVAFTDVSLLNVGFPALRSLDISDTCVKSDSHELLSHVFPSVERFIAENTFYSECDNKFLPAWPKLKVLKTGNPNVDFDYHNDPFWDL